jgi:squalene synthase HpnC
MSSSGDLTESASPRLVTEEVMGKARVENFSVASRLLPRRYREHLLAMYGYARFVDDLGDLVEGDRLAQLDWAEAEVTRAFAHKATHPIFIRAGNSAIACEMSLTTLTRLIQANRQDQTKRRYATFQELLQYCTLSANPVGQMVLAIFRQSYPLTCSHSDEICSALQIVEHLQDLAEDYAIDRIYLPTEDIVRFGITENELSEKLASRALRDLICFEADRARELMVSGMPLVRLVHGYARLAIAGFIGGGLAQLDAIASANFDVLAQPVKATKFSMARRSISIYLRRGAHS